jgi:hypothetical protein
MAILAITASFNNEKIKDQESQNLPRLYQCFTQSCQAQQIRGMFLKMQMAPI